MSDAVLISRKEIGTSQLKQFLYDVPSVSTNSVSSQYRFTFDNNVFNLEGLRIASGSTDYDFRFFDKSGVSTPTIHLVIERTNENLLYGETGIDIAVYNNDTTQGPYLYGEFDNNDLVNNTGTISCAFLIRY